MLSIDAFLRALQRDVAWDFFYGTVNFDDVFGTVNHYGTVDMFAGRYNDAYRKAELDHIENFETPIIRETFKAMLDDWTNDGFDPFASPDETDKPFGVKDGSNTAAVTRRRVTAQRMVGVPGDEQIRTDATHPVNRMFADVVPGRARGPRRARASRARSPAFNLFAYLSRSRRHVEPVASSACARTACTARRPRSTSCRSSTATTASSGSSSCPTRSAGTSQDRDTGAPRAKVTMRAGDVAAMPGDIRHQGYSPKRSMLLVWENASPELPELIAPARPASTPSTSEAVDMAITTQTMTDEQRKSVALEYLKAFDNGGVTSTGGSDPRPVRQRRPGVCSRSGASPPARTRSASCSATSAATLKSIVHHYSHFNWIMTGTDMFACEGTSHGEHQDGPWRAGDPEWAAGRWCDVFEVRDFLIQRCFIYLDPDYAGPGHRPLPLAGRRVTVTALGVADFVHEALPGRVVFGAGRRVARSPPRSTASASGGCSSSPTGRPRRLADELAAHLGPPARRAVGRGRPARPRRARRARPGRGDRRPGRRRRLPRRRLVDRPGQGDRPDQPGADRRRPDDLRRQRDDDRSTG